MHEATSKAPIKDIHLSNGLAHYGSTLNSRTFHFPEFTVGRATKMASFTTDHIHSNISNKEAIGHATRYKVVPESQWVYCSLSQEVPLVAPSPGIRPYDEELPHATVSKANVSAPSQLIAWFSAVGWPKGIYPTV